MSYLPGTEPISPVDHPDVKAVITELQDDMAELRESHDERIRELENQIERNEWLQSGE